MKRILSRLYALYLGAGAALASLLLGAAVFPGPARAQQVSGHPDPVVAIHVSELTQALEIMPAVPPTPTGPGTTGYQWWTPAWRYFVAHEAAQEALRSDGTPFITVSDSDIAAGRLRNGDGSPRYPIVISLDAEAIADNEIAPLREYVAAGGFLFTNSSSFTRRPDGTSRGDFALASEMGVHAANAGLLNWYPNRHFTKTADTRLTAHIPAGTLTWTGPLDSDEIPWGSSPVHELHGGHYVWQVTASDATVAATGDQGPLLAIKNYGQGRFIYHGAFQPLFGDATDPGMYSYVIFRRAIEWAFEATGLPIVKVSPWPFPYDAALNGRHDFEGNTEHIRAIEASAEFDHAAGVAGDYYFCTGALREDLAGDATVVAGLKRAVTGSGATIGSHNGGLKNPGNSALLQGSYDYWHWGPDEALDTAPPGYPGGKAYASASLLASFQDIEGWFAGLDNGRAGCGPEGSCPRLWVSPYGNSLREDSLEILDSLAAATAAEQKVSVFPQRTLSTRTQGKYFSPVTLPLSTWYVGGEIAQAIDLDNGLEYYTVESIREAVDFYHGLGAFINFYTHQPSNNGGMAQEYITYSATKPRVWSTNAAGVSDWWRRRSTVLVAPALSASGDTVRVTASVSGATDPQTAVEIVLPPGSSNVKVYRDGQAAGASEYRTTASGIKVLVGESVSLVEAEYSLQAAPGGTVLFSDGFTRNQLSPWTGVLGTWTITDSVLRGSSEPFTYAIAMYAAPQWSDYTVEARIQFPAGAFGGGLGGRVDAATGARYTAAIYPDGSAGGSNVLKLVKFRDWTTWNYTPLRQASLPAVGTGWHTLALSFAGNRITVSYDGAAVIDVTDNNFDSRPPYPGGGISADLWTYTGSYLMALSDVVVSRPDSVNSPPAAGNDAYSTGADNVLEQAAPGVLANDNDPEGAVLTAVLVSGPSHGSLTLHADGSFLYTPAAGYAGSDSFTYAANDGTANSAPATAAITMVPGGSVLFSDDFARDQLAPWTAVLGTWTITNDVPGTWTITPGVLGTWTLTNGVLQGLSEPFTYAIARYDAPQWTDYTVEARIQLPAGAFGGGIGGRVDAATGARYTAAIYPDGSAGGSNVLKLVKFRDWTTWNYTPMQQVSLPDVGTGWHTLALSFAGNRIKVSYDGAGVIEVTDNNYDSRAPYPGGGISADLWTHTSAYLMGLDNVTVRVP